MTPLKPVSLIKVDIETHPRSIPSPSTAMTNDTAFASLEEKEKELKKAMDGPSADALGWNSDADGDVLVKDEWESGFTITKARRKEGKTKGKKHIDEPAADHPTMDAFHETSLDDTSPNFGSSFSGTGPVRRAKSEVASLVVRARHGVSTLLVLRRSA